MGITISGEIFLTLPFDTEDQLASLISVLYSDIYRLYLIALEKPENYDSFPTDLAFLSLSPRSLVLPADIFPKTVLQKEGVELSAIEKTISSFVPKSRLYPADSNRSLTAIDEAFQKLWDAKAVYLDTRPILWCNKCKTTLTRSETLIQDSIRKKLYIKLKIDNDVFFICRDIDDVIRNLRGINVNPHEIFTIMTFGSEKWIVPERIEEDVKNKIGIFAVNVSKTSGRMILSYFKNVPTLSIEKIGSGALAPAKNMKHYDLMKNVSYQKYKPEFEVIYTEQIKIKAYHCKFCGEPVSLEEKEALFIKQNIVNFATLPTNLVKSFNFSNILISSNLKTVPKIPLLKCNSCGKIELGANEKPCSCGGVLSQNFGYDPNFLTLGVYYLLRSTKNTGLLYKRDMERRSSLFMAFSHLRNQYFTKIKIIPENPENTEEYLNKFDINTFRLGLFLNDSLRLSTHLFKSAEKFINHIKNIVNYAKIYGVRDSSDNDRWILSRLEKTKQEYLKNMDLLDYKKALENLQEFVNYYFSRIYLKLTRFQPVPRDVIYGIFVMAYPFIPSQIDSLKSNFGFDKLNLNMGEFEIDDELDNEMQKLLDLRHRIMKIRQEYKIPLKKPIKRLVLVGKDEDLTFINNNISKVSTLTNILRINTFQDWKEITLKVEANKKEIMTNYRQWVSKISDLLSTRDPAKVKEEIERGGFELGIEGQTITIMKNMVNFVQKIPDGYIEIDTPYGKGYVNILQDEQIKKLYLVNRILHSIENMRKDINIDYDDYIDISISDLPEIREILKGYKEHFSNRLLYKRLTLDSEVTGSYIVSWKILEYTINIGITPLFKSTVIKAFEQLPYIDHNIAEELFEKGITSIYELMHESTDSLVSKLKIDEQTAKNIVEHLKNIEKFPIVKDGNRYLCSLCGTELELHEEYCPRCLAPQNWKEIVAKKS